MNIAVKFLQIVTICIFASTFYVSAATNNVLCYYQSWAAQSAYPPEDIDVNICTHLNYAFLGINEDGSLRLDGGDGVIKRVANLKQRNPKLKLLFSVGGWEEGSDKFARVAADSGKKNNMAQSALWFIQTYNFDGVDIDWEVPTQRGGTPADKENFIDMLSVIRNVFNSNGGHLLTVATAASFEKTTYNVQAISKIVDFINIMTYDFHNAGDAKTGENSPLYAAPTDSDWQKRNANCDAAINNWMNAGAAREKLILGLAFYGHTFQLADPNQHAVGAPVSDVGMSGGSISYREICKLKEGWQEEWENDQEVPYKYKGNQWIGFDNVMSIGLKVQYAKKRSLGGVMVWAIDQDDRDGACGAKNPLLQAIKSNFL